MHFKGLDLNLLVILDAVLTEKSTTRAGKRLHLSQPATSSSLSRLREFFGDQLLVRSGNQMVLTPFAQRLLPQLRLVLDTTETLIGTTGTFNPATSTRTFVINMSDVTANIIVSKCFTAIRKAAPGIQIEMITLHEVSREPFELGKIDFNVVPDRFLSPMHPSEPLFDDDFVCLAWSGNERLKKGLSVELFRSLRHITARMKRDSPVVGDLLMRETGMHLRFELILPSLAPLAPALIGTDMIAIIHRGVAEFYAKYLPLKMYPVPVELPKGKAFLQWNRHHDSDEGTQWIRRMIIDGVRG